jgi:NarL family two-component system response regulator LiaR
VAESGGLLNRCTPKGYHRFESCRLRHYKFDMMGCRLAAFRILGYSRLAEIDPHPPMRRTILIYGLAMAALVAILKYIEYQYFIRDIPLEFYIGFIAIMFTALGIWAGLRLTRPKIVDNSVPFSINKANLEKLGISKREYEVLELISQGLSNQEIAEKLFVSTSTVKTHASNIFSKLDANRRTQAVQRAKELRLIP